MRNIQDHKTGYIFDPWDYLGPKRRKLLEQSWAGVFRRYLFDNLPVEMLASYFDESMGRPSKELYQMLGAIVLQQMQDLSDEEAVAEFAFDDRWHYALDITSPSDEETYVCERTLWSYRRIVLEEGLDAVLFEQGTDELIKAFSVDTSKQRLDSTLIRSNMRSLGRVRIFAETIRKFLSNLKRQHQEIFEAQISAAFCDRYLNKKCFGCFSQVKPSEAQHTLQNLGKDLLYLVELFKGIPQVCRLNSYHLMERVLREQCVLSGDGEDKNVQIKPPKDVPSDSLQNPSDPDAGYDAHKGKGYLAQIMETYMPKTPTPEDTDSQEPVLNLITYAEVKPAHVRDSTALIPAIEATDERDCKAEELAVDTAYAGDENVQRAAVEHDVEIVGPTHCSDAENGTLGIKDFRFNEDTTVIEVCPRGEPAQENYRTAKERNVTTFDVNTCRECPEGDRCPVRITKKKASLYYDDKQIRLALRRQYEETEEFRERYRWRAGIEATNSRYKSQTGVGKLRVRGLAKVRFAVRLKALGLNIHSGQQGCMPPVYPSLRHQNRRFCLRMH